MKGFFQQRDPWGHSLTLWILAGLAFLAPLTVWSLKDLQLDNDMQTWLPAHEREARVFQWLRTQFPDEQKVIVAWEGSTLKDPRIHRFAEALRGAPGADGVRRGGSPWVADVLTPEETIERMVANGVEPQHAMQRLSGVILGTGWMKVHLTEAGRSSEQRSIRDLVEHVESVLGVKLTVHEQVTDWIDEAYLEELDQREEGDAPPPDGDFRAPMIPEHDFQLSWSGIRPELATAKAVRKALLDYRGFATADAPTGRQLVDDCFFTAGTPIAVAVTLSEAGAAEPDDAVRSIRQTAITCGIPEPNLHMGGRAVTAASLNEAVRKVQWDASAGPMPVYRRSIILASAVVGLVLAFVFLRSLRLGVLVVGLSCYATAVAVGLIPLTGVKLNMVLVVMPTLMVVLALSSAIHVANYWRHAAAENPQTAASRALAMARQPCALSALATAIGLASLACSSLRPVWQFGLFAASGCLVILVMVLYGLPALLHAWPGRRPARGDVEGRGWKQFGVVVHRHWKLVSFATVAACLAATCGLRNFQTETKVVRYFPEASRLTKDYLYLEDTVAGITPVDVVIRFDKGMRERTQFLERLEIVRAVEAKLRGHSEISGALSLADYQPETPKPEPGASRMDMLKYIRKSQAAEESLAGPLTREAAALFAIPRLAADLNRPGDAALNGPGDELWRISARARVMSDVNYGRLTDELNACVQSVTRYHPGTSHVVTGTVPLFLRTQQAVLKSLVVSFGLAFAIISIVMMCVLKDVAAGLLSMVPNVLPISSVFGLLAWNELRIDIGTMVTASVALGIAVDGTLHLLTWFLDGLRRGQSRFHAMADALAHCAPAMWQTSATVAFGLLMLSAADLLLISRFGWLMAALIGAALVADLVLLPALLSGWLGALLERRITKAHARVVEHPCVIPAPHLPLGRRTEAARSAG